MLHKKLTLGILIGFLALMCAGFAGICVWKEYQRTNIKTTVEIIQYFPESNSALATTQQSGGLFTFSFPASDKNYSTGADLTRTGSVLVLTGGDSWLLSYPMSYPNVIDVEYVSKREDFVEKYFDTLLQTHQNSTPEQLTKAIDQLSDLNDGEKEGLGYLILCELGQW